MSNPHDAAERQTDHRPLPEPTRSWFESRLDADLSGVRVHTGADAYNVGDDIAFGAGLWTPDTSSGRRTLAHELAHVVQGRQSATPSPGVSAPADASEREAERVADQLAEPGLAPASVRLGASPIATVQRQPDAGGSPPPPTGGQSAAVDIPLIPQEQMRQPGPRDLLVGVFGTNMVALPATGAMVVLQPPPVSTAAPPTPVLAVPTVAKESVKMVNVGGNTGFLLDAGGEPVVVTPAAFAAMISALGTTTVVGMAITHIHEDHVQSLVALVRAGSIRPENLHFPAAFAANANAPSSTFAQLLQALQSDPTLRSLGYAPNAAFGSIQTPAQGNWFRIPLRVGDVEFEYYGLSEAFRVLQRRRAAGQPQAGAQVESQRVPSLADTASLLTRVTHIATGFRMLILSDLRLSDLAMFKTAMGDAAYNEMLSGVRVVEGLGHHLGALESTADRDALVEFLTQTQLQSGRLIVVAQSQETRSGRQFLNRSLIEALNKAGVDVHVALEPQGGQVGAFTVTTDGRVTYAGGGRAESLPGDPAVRAQIDRLNRHREAESILGSYQRFVKDEYRKAEDVKQAREALEGELENYLRTIVGNIRSGASGRAQGTLAEPAAQAQALARVEAEHPVEQLLTPAVMAQFRELNRQGPYRVTLERALETARTTGRMPPEGIDALWELDREVAQRLLGESGMSGRAQRQTMAQLPGAAPGMAARGTATILLAIEVVNLVAPIVQDQQRRNANRDVGVGGGDIDWWLAKGVRPDVYGIQHNWLSKDEPTTDLNRVRELYRDDDLDYLALTGIPEDRLMPFTVWSAGHLKNFRDWDLFVERAVNSGTLRRSGPDIEDLSWEYRKGSIAKGTVYGYNITIGWGSSDLLNKALRSAATEVVRATEQQISMRETKPGELSAPDSGVISRADTYRSATLYETLPQATGRKKFKANVEPVLYTLFRQRRRTGYSKDALFLTFSPAASSEREVPTGYVVVGGADFNTYVQVYDTDNIVSMPVQGPLGTDRIDKLLLPNTREVLLAKVADLEDVH